MNLKITVKDNLCSFEGTRVSSEKHYKDLVTIPEGYHPFPSRTRKLRPPGLMILGPKGPGKVSRCQVVQETIDMMVSFL